MFKEVGYAVGDGLGMIFDGVSLTCLAPALTYIKLIGPAALSIPAGQVPGLRHIYLLAEDVWMYHYNKEEYEGAIFLVFNATANIESLKFAVSNSIFHWQNSGDYLPISDYKPYTC